MILAFHLREEWTERDVPLDHCRNSIHELAMKFLQKNTQRCGARALLVRS